MRFFAPLRHPVFARFFAGQAVSQLGDYVFFVALTWEVIELSGSAVDLGRVLGSYIGAQVLFLLAGGMIADRFPRRRVVVASDVVQAILAAAMAALAYFEVLTLRELYVFAALFGSAQAFAMPALGAFVPETVPASALIGANSLYQATRAVSTVAGPALGAAIIGAAGTPLAFAVNAASFLVSATLLASAAPLAGAIPPLTGRERSALSDLKDAARFVAGAPWLWITIVLFAVLNAAETGPRNAVLPVFATEALDAGVDGVGLLLSAMAVGSLLSFLVLGSLPPLRRRGLVAYSAIAVAGLSVALISRATTLAQVLGLEFVRGAAFGAFALLWETSLQDQIAPALRGRVGSLDLLGSWILLPVAVPAAGVAAEAFGARGTFLVGGLVVLACGLVGLVYRRASAFTAEERGERPA